MESLYELEKKNHEQEQELNNERLVSIPISHMSCVLL